MALFAGELATADTPLAEPSSDEAGGEPTVAVSVDDLFARLRASSAEEVARAADAAGSAPEDITDGPAHDDEPSPFMRRDDVLAPIIVRLARKLKRVLADEQNDVLDVLRRKEPVKNLDALLPWEAAHVDAYRTAIGDEALDAALAGAEAMAPESVKRHRRRITDAGIVSSVVDSVGDVIVALRERLDHSIGENEGDNVAIGNHVRAIYREWKTQRLDDAAIALAHTAYARAGAAVLQPGTMVVWAPDSPSAPTCEEAAMNVAAGPIAMGGRSLPVTARRQRTARADACFVEIDIRPSRAGAIRLPKREPRPPRRSVRSRFAGRGRIILVVVVAVVVALLLSAKGGRRLLRRRAGTTRSDEATCSGGSSTQAHARRVVHPVLRGRRTDQPHGGRPHGAGRSPGPGLRMAETMSKRKRPGIEIKSRNQPVNEVINHAAVIARNHAEQQTDTDGQDCTNKGNS